MPRRSRPILSAEQRRRVADAGLDPDAIEAHARRYVESIGWDVVPVVVDNAIRSQRLYDESAPKLRAFAASDRPADPPLPEAIAAVVRGFYAEKIERPPPRRGPLPSIAILTAPRVLHDLVAAAWHDADHVLLRPGQWERFYDTLTGPAQLNLYDWCRLSWWNVAYGSAARALLDERGEDGRDAFLGLVQVPEGCEPIQFDWGGMVGGLAGGGKKAWHAVRPDGERIDLDAGETWIS